MQKSSEFQHLQLGHLIKAPLATFDTIDLGDELPKAAIGSSVRTERPVVTHGHAPAVTCTKVVANQAGVKSTGVAKQEKVGQPTKPKQQNNPQNSVAIESPKNTELTDDRRNPCSFYDRENEEGFENYVYISHIQTGDSKEKTVIVQPRKQTDLTSNPGVNINSTKPARIDPPPPPTLPKASSFSSSSSDSESGSITVSSRRSLRQRRRLPIRPLQNPKTKDLSPITLSPEIVDPASITSPSKRKAYEKRLQRLQVKTSPIARPRSTTPINVITLDEYVVLSSPEKSPNSPSITEKLKITLPPDEFCVKPRSPRKSPRVRTYSEEDSCFEFSEELLFSHTRSAYLITEGGKLPDSPRRVLIPPTISPSSSPKLAPAAKLKKELDGVPGSPRLVYIQSKSPEDENWATFPDVPDSSISNSCQNENYVNGKAASYANESSVDASDLPLEEEEILTVNIAKAGLDNKGIIDIVLSSNSSSNIPSPSTPDKITEVSNISQSETPEQGKEERRCRETVIPIINTPRPEEELVEKVLSSSPRETYL